MENSTGYFPHCGKKFSTVWKTLWAAALLLPLSGCAPVSSHAVLAGHTMGTTYSIRIAHVQVRSRDLQRLQADVDAALAASVFHAGTVAIPALKSFLHDHGIEVRLG